MTPSAYLAYIFQSIIGELREGEEYWTVTNLKFWTHQFVGESQLLSANREAALRGVVVKRVFLIDGNEWHGSEKEVAVRLLEKHLGEARKVQASVPGGMQVRCLLREDFAAARERYGHFAIVLHEKDGVGDFGSLIVKPENHVEGIVRRIQLDFTAGGRDRHKHRHIDLFQDAFSEAIDLDTFLRSPGQPKNAA
jgi:hypothetical protein